VGTTIEQQCLETMTNCDYDKVEVMSDDSEFHTDVLATSKARPPTATRRKSGVQRRSEQEAVVVER
jgi:hypothetical protein